MSEAAKIVIENSKHTGNSCKGNALIDFFACFEATVAFLLVMSYSPNAVGIEALA